MEITWESWKPGFNCHTRKYFFWEFKYLFSIGILYTVALLSLKFDSWVWTLKVKSEKVTNKT